MADFQRLLASWSHLVGSDLSAGGSQLGQGPQTPEASSPSGAQAQQLLEFKSKAISSVDLSSKA